MAINVVLVSAELDPQAQKLWEQLLKVESVINDWVKVDYSIGEFECDLWLLEEPTIAPKHEFKLIVDLATKFQDLGCRVAYVFDYGNDSEGKPRGHVVFFARDITHLKGKFQRAVERLCTGVVIDQAHGSVTDFEVPSKF